MAFPNAFIVGVNKAGTTAVFNALSRQHGVCASSTKETHYFDPLKYGMKPAPLERYQDFFSPSPRDTAILEATPGYFYGGREIATAIRSVSPSGRVAIILREPGARAFSWWRFCRTRLLLPQDLDFETYLDRCETLGLAPETDSESVAWRGLSGGNYAHWLPAWQSVFGENLLVMYSDDFQEHPADSLRRIGTHLRIDVTSNQQGTDNVSVDIKNATLQRAALAMNRYGERFFRQNPEIKQKLLTIYYRVNSRSRQERMSSSARKRLDEYFANSVSDLRSLLPNVPEAWNRR